MLIVGLTGGTGSGKSEAARRFAAQGFPVIDADKVGHALIAPGGKAETAVIEAFGNRIVTDGTIDRAKLGAIVFADPEALKRLNALVHPAIKADIFAQCARFAASGVPGVIIDAAILADDGLRPPEIDRLIVVLASRKVRMERLKKARQLSDEEAERRINAQTPPEQKVPLADWVIENEGTLAALHAKVDEIVKHLAR